LQIASSVLLVQGDEAIAQLCYPNNDASTVLFARSADFEDHGGFGRDPAESMAKTRLSWIRPETWDLLDKWALLVRIWRTWRTWRISLHRGADS
jgi:hypothetical protein